MVELGKAYGKYFLLLWTTSFIFLLICILSSFYLSVEKLLTFGIIYALMLIFCMLFWNLRAEPEKNLAIGLIAGVVSLFSLSAVFGLIAQQWQMGLLKVSPAETATAISILTLTPAQLLTIFMNIPGPVAEESCFRIGLWRILSPSLGKNKALIAQAVAFGFFHYFAYGQSIIGMFMAIAAGLALGVIYMVTENELAICSSHLIYNMGVLFLFGV